MFKRALHFRLERLPLLLRPLPILLRGPDLPHMASQKSGRVLHRAFRALLLICEVVESGCQCADYGLGVGLLEFVVEVRGLGGAVDGARGLGSNTAQAL